MELVQPTCIKNKKHRFGLQELAKVLVAENGIKKGSAEERDKGN